MFFLWFGWTHAIGGAGCGVDEGGRGETIHDKGGGPPRTNPIYYILGSDTPDPKGSADSASVFALRSSSPKVCWYQIRVPV